MIKSSFSGTEGRKGEGEEEKWMNSFFSSPHLPHKMNAWSLVTEITTFSNLLASLHLSKTRRLNHMSDILIDLWQAYPTNTLLFLYFELNPELKLIWNHVLPFIFWLVSQKLQLIVLSELMLIILIVEWIASWTNKFLKLKYK